MATAANAHFFTASQAGGSRYDAPRMSHGSFRDASPGVDGSKRVLWTLEKNAELLRCELRDVVSKAGGWDVLMFRDGQLSFTHRWSLEASARFFAASLRRERMRDGWHPATQSVRGTVSLHGALAFVARNDCSCVLDVMLNLHDALSVLGLPCDYQFINMDTLPAMDARRGYPSPTLLWNGKDIFGQPAPTPPFHPG